MWTIKSISRGIIWFTACTVFVYRSLHAANIVFNCVNGAYERFDSVGAAAAVRHHFGIDADRQSCERFLTDIFAA